MWRAEDAVRTALWLAVNRGRLFVVANTDKRGMAEQRLGGPLDESDLNDDSRVDPAQAFHVLGSDAFAPVAFSGAVRQVHERASRNLPGANPTHQFGAHVGREASADLASEIEFPLLEVANENGIEVRGAGPVASDDKILPRAEFNFHPGVATFARAVH
jgi:hypothetical protein